MTPEQQGRIADFLAQPALSQVLALLDADGEEARVIGGAVRDLMLGTEVGDIDLATTCLPQETMRRAKAAGIKAVPTGIEHGTVTLVCNGSVFEATTLRRDVSTDGRHAEVAFGRDFEADALRRDFTVNALALSTDGRLHDYADGLADLAARRIRFIGDAGLRIREDYLRILRFFRFHARFGEGPPDREGLAACIAGRQGLQGLSRERVRAELLKLLVADGAAPVLEAMAAFGLLMPVIGRVPHLARFRAIAERGGDRVDPAFRLAALAVTVQEDALRLRDALRLSNGEFDRIERLAFAQEALGGLAEMPGIARLRHVAQARGQDAVAGALVQLNAGYPSRGEAIDAMIADLAATPPFLPGGADLIALGVPVGPQIGKTLSDARAAWIEAGCPAARETQMALLQSALARER